MGGLLGLAAAPLVAQALLVFLSNGDGLVYRLDGRVLLFTLLASVVTGAICGVAPALQTGRVPLIAALTERSRTTSRGGIRLRKTLIVAQMALTLLLLIAAALFSRTLTYLHERVGFDSERLLAFRFDPTAMGYDDPRAEQTMRDVLQALRNTPGVEQAAVANAELLSGGSASSPITVLDAGSGERFVTDRSIANMRIGPGFFATLGTRVIAGRDFDAREMRAPGEKPRPWRSVIVNESFVRRYFKGRNPLGSHLGRGSQPNTRTDVEIVGIVKDFSRRTLREGTVELVFFPFWDNASADGVFYVRPQGAPESMFAPIRAAIAKTAPGIPVNDLRTFDEQIDRSLRFERMLAALSSGFGLLALLLSAVGLYGVMAFVVTQRRQEIGLRLALGATRRDAVWLVARDALIMTLIGIATAMPLAWAFRRLIESQLFGVRPFDAVTITVAVLLLTLVTLTGALIPAWRAASVSPTEALRLE
jgi:predicted permease